MTDYVVRVVYSGKKQKSKTKLGAIKWQTLPINCRSFSFSFIDFTLRTLRLSHLRFWGNFAPFQFCPGGDRQEKAACKQTADCQPNQGSASGASDGAAEKKEAVKCLAAKVSHTTGAHTASQAVH